MAVAVGQLHNLGTCLFEVAYSFEKIFEYAEDEMLRAVPLV